jgi:hypothetical protein
MERKTVVGKIHIADRKTVRESVFKFSSGILVDMQENAVSGIIARGMFFFNSHFVSKHCFKKISRSSMYPANKRSEFISRLRT